MKNLIFCLIIFSAFFTSCSDDLREDQVDHLDSTTADQIAYAQRTCDSKELHNSLMRDPSYKAGYLSRMQKVASRVSNRGVVDCNEPIIIPIAIHFQRISNPDKACLASLAQRQIDVLNNDFSAMNADATLWSQVAQNYPDVNPSSACVKFCLADMNHPTSSGISDGDPAITYSNSEADENSNWKGYLNVFVRDIEYLGSSPLGGQGNGDGVLVSEVAFGIGQGCGQVTPESPFNLGRTLTHEIGHFFSMDHVWGDGGCNSDDGISDTPNQSEDSAGCPSVNKSTCGSVDMHMNYMDYANDACMYMFSNEQASKMNTYVKVNLQNMIAKGESVCSNMIDDGDDSEDDDESDTEGENDGEDDGENDDEEHDDCPNNGNDDGNNSDNDNDNDNEQDSDGDGVADDIDNCPNTPNADQADADNDGIGSVCDENEGSNGGCSDFTLVFEADDYPEDIEWSLKNLDTKDIVAEGGQYEWDPNNSTFIEDFCLEDGCYKLVVKDLYWDGLCCNTGDGYFYLEDQNGDSVFESDGKYGKQETTTFCISNNQVSSLKIEKDTNVSKLASRKRRVLAK